MSLFGKVGLFMARRRIDGARKGKEGPEMKNVMGFLDGKKRYLLLLVFAVEAIAGLFGYGNVSNVTRIVLGLLGWDPATAVVSAAVITQFCAAGYAIYDGIKKDRENRARLVR